MKKDTGERHARVVSGVDVGACGSRAEGIRFAIRRGDVTCLACRERRSNGAASERQLAKMRKASKVATAMRLSGIPVRNDGNGF